MRLTCGNLSRRAITRREGAETGISPGYGPDLGTSAESVSAHEHVMKGCVTSTPKPDSKLRWTSDVPEKTATAGGSRRPET